MKLFTALIGSPTRMTVEFILFASALILLLLFSSFMDDSNMVAVFGILFTVLVVTYFRHRDTILYTEYLTKKVDYQHQQAHSSAEDMEQLFSMMAAPLPVFSTADRGGSAVVEEIDEESEKPNDPTE